MFFDLEKIKRFANHPELNSPAERFNRLHDLCPVAVLQSTLRLAVDPAPDSELARREAKAGATIFAAATSVRDGGIPEGSAGDVPEEFVHGHLDFMLSRLDNLAKMSIRIVRFLEPVDLLPRLTEDAAKAFVDALPEELLEARDARTCAQAILTMCRVEPKHDSKLAPGDSRVPATAAALLKLTQATEGAWTGIMDEADKLVQEALRDLPPA